MAQYLLEIGVEELPAHSVEPALRQLKEAFEKSLQEENIGVEEIKAYATPRRLAILLRGLDEEQPDRENLVKGPSEAISFSEGAPTKPLLGFMRSQGVEEGDLEIQEVKGTRYVFARIFEKGTNTRDILKELVPGLIRSIHFPKNMRWGGKNIRFARPIRWIVSLYNNEVLPFDLEEIPVGHSTRGHRFLGSSDIEISSIDDYEKLLEENYVIVDQEKRQERILFEAKRRAKELGGEIADDPDLLEELTYIVEYPTAIVGEVKEEYLALPEDVITTPMREHLRYIPVRKEKGLLPYFITIRNGTDAYQEVVAAGNEKVLGARLEDAKFFYKEDLQKTLEDRVDDLSGIVFQDQLGTILDKTKRLEELVVKIGEELDVAEETTQAVVRAAHLAKADLTTHMVSEFPELQGRMGEVYAQENGELPIVAQAIREQYLPRFAGDVLPESTTGSILALAEKLDTIVGLFAVGLVPTGSQDPFGLRRFAIGMIHIIRANNWDLDMSKLIDHALYIYVSRQGLAFHYNEVKEQILQFFEGRLRRILMDEGVSYDLVDAVLAAGSSEILRVFRRAEASKTFFEGQDRRRFIEAFTRLHNLSLKAEGAGAYDVSLATDEQERALHAAYEGIREELDEALCRRENKRAFGQLETLQEPIHSFFDAVMILVEDPEIRENRLALLRGIDEDAQRLIDVTKIVTGE